MIFFPSTFQRAFLQASILYCSACTLRKDKYFQRVFWGISSHWENVSLMDVAILTSLAGYIRGNLTNRPLYAQEASAGFQGSWGVGTTGGTPLCFPEGSSRKQGEPCEQVHQWKRPARVTLLLVPNSRVPFSGSGEKSLESWLRILQRLQDHPREAHTECKTSNR